MNTEQAIQIIESDDAWDTGELGRDEDAVRVVQMTPEMQQAIDDAVGLQMISIRLPKSLIEDFKFLGETNGLKYQTLMRQVLARFAHAEKKIMARKAAHAQIKAARHQTTGPTHSDDNKKRTKIA